MSRNKWMVLIGSIGFVVGIFFLFIYPIIGRVQMTTEECYDFLLETIETDGLGERNQQRYCEKKVEDFIVETMTANVPGYPFNADFTVIANVHDVLFIEIQVDAYQYYAGSSCDGCSEGYDVLETYFEGGTQKDINLLVRVLFNNTANVPDGVNAQPTDFVYDNQ